jgi:glycerophosphoryl diester phosphodiesterase
VLVDRIPDDWAARAQALDVAAIGANQAHLAREQVMAIRGAGYKLTAYTVNDEARAAALFQWGVDAIFTDLPGAMVARFGAGP